MYTVIGQHFITFDGSVLELTKDVFNKDVNKDCLV